MATPIDGLWRDAARGELLKGNEIVSSRESLKLTCRCPFALLSVDSLKAVVGRRAGALRESCVADDENNDVSVCCLHTRQHNTDSLYLFRGQSISCFCPQRQQQNHQNAISKMPAETTTESANMASMAKLLRNKVGIQRRGDAMQSCNEGFSQLYVAKV